MRHVVQVERVGALAQEKALALVGLKPASVVARSGSELTGDAGPRLIS